MQIELIPIANYRNVAQVVSISTTYSPQPGGFDRSTPILYSMVIGMLNVRRFGPSLSFSHCRIAIGLCAALIVCFSGGCSSSGTYTVPKADEETRVTSPNGKLDAVLVREDGGGAAGGWEWHVHIVAKGSPVVRPRSHSIFNAGTLTNEKIIWTQEHLLEIHYDIAYINQFTNIWGSSEIQNGSEGRNEYLVEVRLVPSPRDISVLTPNGEFRRKN